MAFTFDATPAGASANSYITVSDADDYFGGRLDVAEWTALASATTTKEQALSMATYRLDQEEFIGEVYSDTQALKFPRYNVPREYPGEYESETAIPERVKRATCELALALVKDTTLLSDTGLEGYSHIGIGQGALDITPRADRKAGALPSIVSALLRGIRTGGGGCYPVVRG